MKTILSFKSLKISIAIFIILFSLLNAAKAQIPPAPAWVTFTPTGPTTGTATWDVSGGAYYWYIMISTSPTFPGWSGGGGGYPPLSSWNFTGLTVNTTYYVYVSAVNSSWAWYAPTRSPGATTFPLYYNKSGGTNALEVLSNWGTNSDGSGTAPPDFTGNNQVFTLENGTAATIGANWTISGTGSKLVLGNSSVNAITFTIPSGYSYSGIVDIASANTGSNTLSVQNTTIPTLGTLGAGCTVNYSGAGQAIAAATYQNLTLSGSGTKTFASATTINGNLAIGSGILANLGSGLTHTSLGLYLNGVAQSSGTWGATGSGAAHINNTYFSGTGVVNVLCIVSIPDAAFKSALVSDYSINTNYDSEIQCSEAEAFTGTMNVSNYGISDLSGIEAFTNLTILYCSYNSLTNLDITSNTALEYLDCSNNWLTSLNVSGVTNIGNINCAYNQLSSLDVHSNTNLNQLYCSYNQLTNLDVSAIITNFTSLLCNNNLLTSLDVSHNTNLTQLACGNNLLTSLDVSHNNAISQLLCENNQLTGLIFPTSTAILGDGLDCSGNQFTSLDLSAFTLLTSLNCSNNLITTLDLSENTQLNSLYCYNNQLTSLNLKNGNNTAICGGCFGAFNNPGLMCIQVDNAAWSGANWYGIDAGSGFSEDCSTFCGVYIPDPNFKYYLINNPLVNTNADGTIECSEAASYTGTIDVSGWGVTSLTGIEAFTHLTELRCAYNSISNLDISSNTALTLLDCQSNQLTYLDVSHNKLLGTLYCSNNQLSGLDVSANTLLTDLTCYSNQIEYLDVSGKTGLTNLDCGYNPLTALDVSSDIHLAYLACYGGLLTNLDVSDNTALTYFYCGDNHLTGLDLSANGLLNQLECYNNQLIILNVKNGNPYNISYFNSSGNPELTCVQVDDPEYSYDNWYYDNGVSFSEVCTGGITWTGTINSDWNTAGNWSPAVVPTVVDNADIPPVANKPVVNENPVAPALCNNLIIESGARLSIASGKALTVNGTLANTAGNAGLVINPGGSLIENSGAAATVKSSIPANEWHLISSPVSGATSNMFYGKYLQTHTEPTNAYTDILVNTMPLARMKGYALWGDADGFTANYTGSLNTGTQNATWLTRSVPGMSGGWNLVGNPYPSSIDWDASESWTKMFADNATYRHVSNDEFTGWAAYINGAGVNGGTRYISPGQGFFIAVSEGFSSGLLQMNNSVRVHNPTTFFKSADVIPNMVRLELSGNNYKDEAVVRFLPEASPEFDGSCDAHKLFSDVPEAPQIYTLGSSEFSINSLPETSIVPVGVRIGTSGTYSIAATEINDLQNISLEDTKTGIFTDLAKSGYIFNFVAGENEQRFNLHFNALSVTENEPSAASIYSYQQTVYVNLNCNVKGDIFICNITGQMIASKLSAVGMNTFMISNTGNYIVKVISKENTVIRKIWIQ
jgi:Leucine-rich repeat (LRR) protein